MAVYQHHANDDVNHVITFAQTEKHIYGSSRLGTHNKSIPMFATQNKFYSMRSIAHYTGKRVYELANHLGNVLSVISDKVIPHNNGGTVDYWLADLRQATDYSPFGVILKNRDLPLTSGTGGVPYRYGYQGSERDDEVKGSGNSYTTEFRMLDPRLGRWLSIDPLAGQFPWQSPYCSMDNNPTTLVDPEGSNARKNEGFGSSQTKVRHSRFKNPKGAAEHWAKKWERKGYIVEGSAQFVYNENTGSTTITYQLSEAYLKEMNADEITIFAQTLTFKYVGQEYKAKYNRVKNMTWDQRRDYLSKQAGAVVDQELYVERLEKEFRERATDINKGGFDADGANDGEAANRIGENIVTYRYYEKPLRREERKLKRMQMELDKTNEILDKIIDKELKEEEKNKK